MRRRPLHEHGGLADESASRMERARLASPKRCSLRPGDVALPRPHERRARKIAATKTEPPTALILCSKKTQPNRSPNSQPCPGISQLKTGGAARI